MLEIILLWQLCKKMGVIVRNRGRKPIGFQAMLIGMWIGGEFLGGVVGAIATGGGGAPVYICAIIGAAVGAVSAFAIAKSLAPMPVMNPAGVGFPVVPLSYRPPAAPENRV